MQFHLKNTLTNLGMILLLSSCTGHQPGGLDEPASLFPVPLKVPVNTKAGYFINSLGDTLPTGVPVPSRGKVIQRGRATKPLSLPAMKPKVVSVENNIHNVPESLTVIAVDRNSLRTIYPGAETSSSPLVNVYNGESFTM